ncbi:MAG: hypothetical protein C4329_13540 [Chitinophagaceae bacterium]
MGKIKLWEQQDDVQQATGALPKYFVPFLLLISLCSFCQKTTVAIEGISVFKIGDTVTQVNNYGCNCRELFIDNDYNFSEKYQSLDSGKNFCNNSRVFHCDTVQVDEFKFRGATLTYFNNKLIDIRLDNILLESLSESESQITDILKLKYGQNFGKIFLEGYYYNILKYKAKGVKITPAIDKHLQDLYLGSIYWTNGNITISVGDSNKIYDFVEKKYKSAAGFADGGLISVTNYKEYERLIACSNLDYQKKLTEYFKKLKQKTRSF